MTTSPRLLVQVAADGTELRLAPADRARLADWAGKWVVIRPVANRRSLEANAYWWAVPVAMLAEHCGYDPEQMHYALLGEWRGYIAGPKETPVPRCTSSSQLTSREFSELIDWVQRWAAEELDVQIPLPGEWARTREDDGTP